MAQAGDDDGPVEFNVAPEQVCDIIAKARAYETTIGSTDTGAGVDEDEPALEDVEHAPADPTATELKDALDQLGDDEIIDLIALVSIGRGDFAESEWEAARELAEEQHHVAKASQYLMGLEALGDLLEEGFSRLGYSCENYD